MTKCKEANLGSIELCTWADGRFVLEIEARRISDEQSADRLSFTAAIYNC